MGKVIGLNKYGRLEQACACDARCTHASGPNCDCSCGGENHGKGTLVEIVIIDGTVRVTTPCEAKEAQRGNEWREAVAAAKARLEAKHGTSLDCIKRGIRIPYDLWSEANNANNAFFRIQGSKIHKTRMEKMNKFLM
jgi:hypothetical protein